MTHLFKTNIQRVNPIWQEERESTLGGLKYTDRKPTEGVECNFNVISLYNDEHSPS